MPIEPEFERQILECLRRSGYLLESRLVRSLSEARFFVEPNVAVLDPRTGKSREIDIRAEYFDHDPLRRNVTVQSYFAIEAINNNLPLVLLTPHPGSPTEDVTGFLRYRTTPSPAAFLEAIDVYDAKGVFDDHYSQYAALSRKKPSERKKCDDLMASHSDDLYSSLLKLAEFVEQQAVDFDQQEWLPDDAFWRLLFWQGVLVVGGDLVVATEDKEGKLSLTEVDNGTLIFNFHAAQQPKTVLIEVVRERQLLPYLTQVIAIDRRLASEIHAARSSAADGAT